MKTGGTRGYKYRYKYGVGYPAAFKYLVARRVPNDVCDKLNLYVFLVEESGAVEMLEWRDLKKAQVETIKK